jgi:Fe2+ transport system protein FeoA
VPKVRPGQAADPRVTPTPAAPAVTPQGQSVTVPVDPAARVAWFRAELQRKLLAFGASRGSVVEIVQQDPTLFMSQRGLDELNMVLRSNDLTDARQAAETGRRYAQYYRMADAPDSWYSWAPPAWNRYSPFELYARYREFQYDDQLAWRMAELQQRLRDARRNCDPTRYNCGF